ncbi:hypothetical protein LWI28_004287 [Acer negundo]|uniref:Uncharacterized protein n=1 Tax=Acer negundo TaxID=4023 RepID=A0AAD5NUS4_ACENE|nr:hypothetical protein LWI28_004287 [Acer negundo]
MITIEELKRRDDKLFEKVEKEADAEAEEEANGDKKLECIKGVVNKLSSDACDKLRLLDIPRKRKEIKKPKKIGSKKEKHVDTVLPEEFRRCIKELKSNGILFVIKKELTKTELNKDNNCLSIPKNQIISELLNAEEYAMVKYGFEVLLIQPSLKQSRLQLKKWDMSHGVNFCYNLINGWYRKLVKNLENEFCIGSR